MSRSSFCLAFVCQQTSQWMVAGRCCGYQLDKRVPRHCVNYALYVISSVAPMSVVMEGVLIMFLFCMPGLCGARRAFVEMSNTTSVNESGSF